MSASLVGSEMCIRDRFGGAPSGRTACRRSRASSRGGSRGGQAPCGRGPVSYTHLTLPTICSV
eukprot:1414614-Alexandrium_andersonii.AAC.1